ALYLRDGVPAVCINLFGDPVVVSGGRVDAGRHEIAVLYERTGKAGGPIALAVDGVVVGDGALPLDLPFRWQIGGGGVLVGRDAGFPVCDDYQPPFAYGGTIEQVTLESLALSPPSVRDEVRAALHRE